MTTKKYRAALPQLGDTRLLTDGGLETTLIFHDGIDLPLFASFHVFRSVEEQRALWRYYERYARIALAQKTGFILDSATWRASRDWGDQLGYSARDLAAANHKAVAMLFDLRREFEADQPFVISGNMGPRGDGYAPEMMMTAAESENYHARQVAALDEAGVDMISAITMTHAGEAAGIARACAKCDVPLALSFTVETDGHLPSGQPLGDAIREVDADAAHRPSYYMINCAHPDHFRDILDKGEDWTLRIRGIRANASRMSHAELDEADVLDDGNPAELGQDYANLLRVLPNLRVFGGCCGTDHRHVHSIGEACIHAPAA
ncbi:homocysteine S-methyltransferase family protein [uncultured Roseobacter sp.]|uniref:homocysteine S-methyltransferase family protein n=1 Tax=uncultured Roseobacter sp. TaxID=114847 RepID=UPI002610A261|nr:homocysteine S-methyltransferase family protein [uncultured Roseobacter sp.]